MNIIEYVKENYDALDKSKFNDQELVVVLELRNSNEGWGHHYYEGVGVDHEGKVFYCFSSGCSCNGECGITEEHGHDLTMKKFEVNGNSFDLSEIDPKQLVGIQVEFSNY